MTSKKIVPVEIDESKYNKAELDPFVFPSLSVYIGHVASGKSTLLYNLIRMTEPVFDGNVILISPTLLNDPIQQKMIDEASVGQIPRRSSQGMFDFSHGLG